MACSVCGESRVKQSRHLKPKPKASRSRLIASMEAAARRQPNLHAFDDFTPLCPPEHRTCSPVKDDIPQFRDTDHLNGAGAGRLAPSFAAFLTRLGLFQPKP
jgi:hypothetical protein